MQRAAPGARARAARGGRAPMRPFQVSALLVQPHCHMRTGGGSTRRSRSYACSSSSTRPVRARAARVMSGALLLLATPHSCTPDLGWSMRDCACGPRHTSQQAAQIGRGGSSPARGSSPSARQSTLGSNAPARGPKPGAAGRRSSARARAPAQHWRRRCRAWTPDPRAPAQPQPGRTAAEPGYGCDQMRWRPRAILG